MDPTTVPEMTVSLAEAITALTTIGVMPVITIAALVGLASFVYRRFRK